MTYQIPESIFKRHLAVLGMTGSGKSSTTRLVVEQIVAAGGRVCILDTIKSDWWGITSSASGKAPGLPFKILGGERGHVPLHSSAGKAIGHLVGSGKLPLSIIDMEHFEPGGLQRFFVDFVPELLKSVKGVVHLVIEEAHELAPKERAGFGAENMAIFYAKKLATGSRTKGVRLIVATQRIQALHNAVLGSCETVIAHRIGYADDQVPVLKWMKAKIGAANAKTVELELANLADGEGFIAAGAPIKVFDRVKFPLFKTYDNTKTPEHGDELSEIKTAPVDHEELRSIIGDAVAEAEANDPKALKETVKRLTAELAARPVVQPSITATATINATDEQIAAARDDAFRGGVQSGFVQGWNAAWPDGFRVGADRGTGFARAVVRDIVEMKVVAEDVLIPETPAPSVLPGTSATPAWQPAPAQPAASRSVAPPAVRAASQGDSDAYSPTVRKIIDVIHRSHPVALTFSAASLRAGVSRKSSALRSYKKQVEESAEIHIREDGRLCSAPGYAAPPGPGIDPIEEFAQRLSPSYAAMLREIAKRPGDKEDIAARAGISPTSSGLTAGLRELASLSLIEKSGDTYRINKDISR